MTRASLVISLLAVPYGPLLSINRQRGRFAPNLLDPKRLWRIGIRLRRGDSAFVFVESCARNRSDREVEAGRADDAGLLHRGLQIGCREPSARLRHVGDILKDQDIIRVFGAAKNLAIRDACRNAALLMFVVTLAPGRVVLDFVVDSKVFGRMLCTHRHSPKNQKKYNFEGSPFEVEMTPKVFFDDYKAAAQFKRNSFRSDFPDYR